MSGVDSGGCARLKDIRVEESHQVTTVHRLTAVIEREGEAYVALCPELDIASQGETVEESQRNLREALELFFEEASPAEVEERLRSEVYITSVEVAVG